MEHANEPARARPDDAAMDTLRETLARIAERLTGEIEPAPVYLPLPLNRVPDRE